jgi:uncharacterized protein
MKVLIDTNVFLSYILSPDTPRAVTTVVDTCFSQDVIDLLIPPQQLTEFKRKAATKQYFRTRIPHTAIDHFIEQLLALAELLPPLEEFATYTRDPKDDYLVVYGVVNEADYLITGDADLLVLTRIGRMEIVKPSRFLAILRESKLAP